MCNRAERRQPVAYICMRLNIPKIDCRPRERRADQRRNSAPQHPGRVGRKERTDKQKHAAEQQRKADTPKRKREDATPKRKSTRSHVLPKRRSSIRHIVMTAGANRCVRSIHRVAATATPFVSRGFHHDAYDSLCDTNSISTCDEAAIAGMRYGA
jgi:hypothetical protein